MKLYLLFLALILLHQSIAFPSIQSEDTYNSEKDNESSKKIIGSSVVTSVSVILNGEEPQYTDAVGQIVPKSQMPLQVASPINLLNPDRYEFFTFDDSGQLVKRLMTLKEIQSIVANGDGEGATVIHNADIDEKNPEKNVQDIVASVQSVLTKEVEGKKNFSLSEQHILDTPDVSSSWSMILPAIFGNTGGDIFPQSKPQQVVMTPDSDVFEHQPTKPSKRPSKPKPTKKRPITTSTTADTIYETTNPQKIFMNNEEIVKPLFNRVKNGGVAETTYLPIETTIHTSTHRTTNTTKRKKKPMKTTLLADNQTTTKRSTIKRKQTTKPSKLVLSSTISDSSTSKIVIKKKHSTTYSPDTTQKIQQTIQKRKPTTSKPVTTQKLTTSHYKKGSLNSLKPVRQTTQQFGTTAGSETTQRIPTQKYKKKQTTTKKPLSALPIEATKLPQTTIKSKTTAITTLKPSRTSTTKINLTTLQPETQDDSYYTDSTTALSVASIIDSLTQSQEDINTKLSFNQIMESLKDKTSIKSTETNLLNQPKIQPVLYNNADAIQEMQVDTNSRITPINLNITKQSASTVNPFTYDTTTYFPIQEDTTIASDEYSIIKDGSNVVKIEPLFAELLDPILSDLTTTALPITTENLFITSKDDESVTESSEQFSSTEYVDGSTEYTNYEKLPDIKVTQIKYKHEQQNDKILEKNENEFNMNDKNKIKKPNEITEKVQNIIDANESFNMPVNGTPIHEISKKKLNSINQQTEMSMSDFRKTAATLASMFENSEELSTTENSIQNNYEIQSLLSDVISQITDVPPSPSLSDKIKDETNRFTNLAQINANMFLSAPSSANLNTNNKFHTIESLSLKLNKTKDIENNLFLRDHVENEITTNLPLYKDEFEKNDNEMNKNDLYNENKYKTTTNSWVLNTKNNKNSMVHNEQISTTKLGYNSETTSTPTNNEIEMTTLLSTSAEPSEPSSSAESSSEKSSKKEEVVNFSTTEEDRNDYDLKESKENSASIENKSIEDATEILDNLQYATEQVSDESQDYFINTSSKELSTEASQELDSTTTSDENSIETTTDPLTLVELITLPSKHDFKSTESSDTLNITETEDIYTKLGETADNKTDTTDESFDQTTMIQFDEKPITASTTNKPERRKPITLKPVHYFKQPASQSDQKLIAFNGVQQRPLIRPPSLTNLKINQISQASRAPVKLEPTPEKSLGLEESTQDLQEDIQEFSRLCNELAFSYWRSITSEKISPARSLVISPFAITSMLSMVFLGARGSTSGEMNEILRLDDMVTFNPHLVFKNITESVENAKDSDIASSAFVREVFSDRTNGKILQFFKEKTQQLYSGHVEEVNFNVVNDIIRRRTNFLVKRHTMGKIMEYLRTNSVWVNGPLSTISANLFQTDCVRGSTQERDGEMFFQVHPSIRQRRLVPVPAVVWRSGFTAGYDHEVDATVVAFGNIDETVSTIYVMPGQHGLAVPGDNLERLEKNIMENGISKNVWSHLLTTLMERPGLEVQLPRFSHRSFVNASLGLQKLGLRTLFNSENADLRGLTGSSNKDVYLADMIQINTFSTCGEGKIGENHHVEMYPAPPLRKRNSDIGETTGDEHFLDETQVDFGSIVHESARGFYDDLLDPKYLELPLPLRPRQARIPDAPRLRFDKPFLYFVRHNPTGMILFMGRFNPRLLP